MHLDVQEGHINVDRDQLIYVTGAGAEVPFESEGDVRRYHRDAEDNPGIMLVMKGIHNFLGLEVEMTQRHMMNARTAGRIVVLLHELFERIGEGDALHQAIAETRAEAKEKFANLDFAEHPGPAESETTA